jgi:hypothetical protein
MLGVGVAARMQTHAPQLAKVATVITRPTSTAWACCRFRAMICGLWAHVERLCPSWPQMEQAIVRAYAPVGPGVDLVVARRDNGVSGYASTIGGELAATTSVLKVVAQRAPFAASRARSAIAGATGRMAEALSVIFDAKDGA